MYKNLPPKTTEDHVNDMTTRIDRLEKRPPTGSGLELHVQKVPPPVARHAAMWLDDNP